MEDLETRAREVAEIAVSREGILPFLHVCVENKHLSLINQLLVYGQNPNAKMVCGKHAWERLGRSINAEANPIRILLPEIMPGQDTRFRIVNVYDYDSTDGTAQTGMRRTIAFADRITFLTGATWEMISEAALKDSLERGCYDSEKNIFYLSEVCTGGQQGQTILGLYIDYVLSSIGVQDRLVRLAVSFVVYERFGLKHTIVGALFGKAGRLSGDDKWKFLKSTWFISKRVLDDLEGCTLSFNEIAFINSLLVTDVREEMEQIFEQTAAAITNDELKEELILLKLKLAKAKNLEELYRKRCQMQLFTYPSILLELENEDYLQEERRCYHAGYGNYTED